MNRSDKPAPSAICDEGFVQVKLNDRPTVLVVDDEPLIRELTTIMVEENGGRAITASDGLNALEVFRENREAVSVVFLDFSMPRLNGYDTLIELRKSSPGLPIILVSGLRMTPEVERLYRNGEIEFLSKPFHEVELVKAVNRVIERRKQAAK